MSVHSRIRKARLRQALNATVRSILWFVVGAGTLGAILGLAVFHLPMLALLFILVGPAAMVLGWYYGELAALSPTRPLATASSIVEILEPDLLSQLNGNPTPRSIAEAVARTRGGRFYGARFMIPMQAISAHLSDQPADADAIWHKARELSQQRGREYVENAAVAAALILELPDVDTLLASFNLTREDILTGYDWYIHLNVTAEKTHEKHAFGGIGRDLSFGFTPLLDHVGYNITQNVQRNGLLRRQIEGHEQVLANVINILSSAGRQNVALVGEIGAGKTALVYGLAERLLTDKAVPASVRYRQVIALDASTLISNARGRGELEQLMIRVMNEAVRAKNVILFLDDANLFLEEGTGSVDLSNILLPALQGGAVRIIMAMTESWWQRLGQANPAVAQLANRVAVPPLNREDTLRVAEDQVLMLEWQHQLTYTYQALQSAYDLASRFVQDQVFPGRALLVLEAAANCAPDGVVTAQSVQAAIEQRFGVKVQSVDQATERDTLLHMEDQIHQRMINQTRAVQVVSDALRRARAGVRNTSHPIGTFLFLGPTGVGKTELSKSLAAIYFGGEDRLVRVDLNEFSSANDTARLLESAAANPRSLCAQIAKQPFSVVLLDEIEKAHDNVLNLLLQVLDEGILRDSSNREVNFREAIIIATSNAGADQIRAHIDKGEQLEQFEDTLVNELIDAHVFKPEFINRFDEIVLFRPLTQDELRQVVDLNIVQINRTLANQKVTVALTDTAKDWLATQGYDPRLGARPLRRVIQRTVENVISQKILGGQAAPGSTITLDASDLQPATPDDTAAEATS